MKKLLPILLVFVFPINDKFDIPGFLAAAKAQGIKLYAENFDSPHGFYMAAGGQLHIELYEEAKAPIPESKPGKGDGEAGHAVLDVGVDGSLEDYRAPLQALVKAMQ